MDKQAILDLLTKPNRNQAIFSKIVQAYLKNVQCRKNHVVMHGVGVVPGPQAGDNVDAVISGHRRLYTEVMEVLVDKFNQNSDEKIQTSTTFVEEFVETLIPFLHTFNRVCKVPDPQTEESYLSLQLDITYKREEGRDVGWIEFSCTVIQYKDDFYNSGRNMVVRFYTR